MQVSKLLLLFIALCLMIPLAGCDLFPPNLLGTSGKITPQATLVVSRTGSMDVDINGGIVSIEDGAEVEIPLGALGKRVVSVSIEIDDNQTIAPPEGFSSGSVYQFGPVGATFDLPVRVSIPIPAGRDPSDVLGVLTLDPLTNERVALPGVVDTVERIISIKTTHFSPYAVYWRATLNATFTGGHVKLINTHVQGSDNYVQNTPDSTTAGRCSGKPRSVGRGVYFLSYNPNNLSTFVRPGSNRIYAFDGQTVLYWLPAGTYTVVEFEWSAAINSSPLDSPCQKWMVRPPQVITVKELKTIAFGSYNTVRLPAGFTESADVYISGTEQSTLATSDGELESFVVVESDLGVMTRPTRPTTFIITVPWTVTLIQTYHHNYGEGSSPGAIELESSTGDLFGPWDAQGAEDPAGVANGFWRVETNVVIPAGTYTVIDSSPATWSQNKATNGRGMVRIYGTPN